MKKVLVILFMATMMAACGDKPKNATSSEVEEMEENTDVVSPLEDSTAIDSTAYPMEADSIR